MTNQIVQLLDTTNPNDARSCGHLHAIEPKEGGLHIEVETGGVVGTIARLWGQDGQVELIGDVEIEETIKALQRALQLGKRISA